MIDNVDGFFSELASQGEEFVRKRLARGDFANHKIPLVQEWLRLQEERRLNNAVSRSEAREEESLSISRKALAISEEANSISKESNSISRNANSISDKARRYARWSNIIAIIAIIISAAVAIYEYISKKP
jgi:hypothetical protein